MLGDNQFVDERGRRYQGRGIDSHESVSAGGQGWSDQSSDQPTIDLASYWRLALKYRFLIIGCFLGALVIGATLTLLMTPIYTAEATLQIDREAARIIDSEEVTPRENMMQGEEFFQTQYGLLRSRSLAERVIESLGLASSDEALEAMGVEAPAAVGTAADRAARRKGAALAALQHDLSVSPVRGSRLVAINYDNPSPVVAARIANGFAENFIQSNLDRKFESSAYARQFLEERIAQTKERLEDAEQRFGRAV